MTSNNMACEGVLCTCRTALAASRVCGPIGIAALAILAAGPHTPRVKHNVMQPAVHACMELITRTQSLPYQACRTSSSSP